MLKIWGRSNSTNVKKVLWVAEELGLAYERIDAGGAFPAVDPAMNPNGLIPVVEDRGRVLWESNAIVRYLAAEYGAGRLWSPDAGSRAEADRWMDWASINVTPPFVTVFWNLVRTAPEQRDMAAVQQAIQKLEPLVAMLDRALKAQPYLSGEQLGIGDIPMGCIAYAWFNLPIQRPAATHMTAWYERLLAREAYLKAVAIPLT